MPEEKDYSDYPGGGPSPRELENSRLGKVKLYEDLGNSGWLPDFAKKYPQSHAELKGLYEDHMKATGVISEKPVTKKPTSAAKPAVKKAAPAKKK